ncbi:MAG: hypothetical protein P8Y78_00460 [Acidihalobacter sp.]
MSDTVLWLFLAGFAGLALGVLMLYAAAFRSGWLWGIVCLLLPPLLLLFIPLRWRRSQYGFYVLLAGLLVSGAALYAGADAPVQAWLQQPQVQSYLDRTGWHGEIRLPFKSYRSEQLPNAAAAAAIRAEEKAAAQAPPPPAPKTKPSPAPTAPPNTFQPVSLEALNKFIGSTVRITGTDGGQVSGQLTRVDGVGVTVAADQGSGSVSYHVAWTRLSGVEVYAPQGSVPPPMPAASTTAAPAQATTTAPAGSANPPASVTVSPAPRVEPLPAAGTKAPEMPVSPSAAAARAPTGAVDSSTPSGAP